jgi:DNA mismatch endonuclease (patch repair protein)
VADVLSKKKRSRVMAAIRSSGNQATEVKLMKVFRTHGITGWRRNQRLLGKPDFVFRKWKVVVFVDGCFWHGCRWHCRMPKSRKTFWEPKILGNKQRDREVSGLLRRQGWRVVRIWEHSLRKTALIVARTQAALASGGRHR